VTRMIRRRLGGVLRTTVAASIPWTALGLLIGLALRLDRGPGEYMVFGQPAPGGLATACAIAGTLVGVVNGLTFSCLLLAAERGKTVEQLRGWRWAMWGAVATGSPVGLLLQSPLIGIVGAALGAAGALAALWVVRRTQAISEQVSVRPV
jgi:hypothetical protein